MRSRSAELIEAAEKFEAVKRSKMAMKQHLLDNQTKKKLLKVAKDHVQGTVNHGLDQLTKMCWAIAKQGLYENTEEQTPSQLFPPEPKEEEIEENEVVVYALATPSDKKLTQSNANYVRIINAELAKLSKNLGCISKFWMSDKGYDKAWDKMENTKKFTPFSVGSKSSAEYEEQMKLYLPTTIKIKTQNPDKWKKDSGFRKTIFARASLFGDINIQDNEASGRKLPVSAFPSSAGKQPLKPKPAAVPANRPGTALATLGATAGVGAEDGWVARRSQVDGSTEHVLVKR